MRGTYSYLVLSSLAFGTLFLASCGEHYKKSNFTPELIRVQENNIYKEMFLSELSSEHLDTVASHYHQNGDGVVHLSVTYDPSSRTQSAMKATNEAAKLTKILRQDHGVPVEVDILPVKLNQAMKVIIAYKSYDALPPKDCDVLSGLSDRNHGVDPDYKFGCSVQTLIAKQIAHPQDLMGQADNSETFSGRESINSTAPIRAGAPQESLTGQSASN